MKKEDLEEIAITKYMEGNINRGGETVRKWMKRKGPGGIASGQIWA